MIVFRDVLGVDSDTARTVKAGRCGRWSVPRCKIRCPSLLSERTHNRPTPRDAAAYAG